MTLQHLRLMLSHVMYYNKMAPFPPYDTEWVEDLKNIIKQMEENIKHDYDSDPVVACKYCNSLHIVSDKWDNSHCMRCGSINELEEFENIRKYQEYILKAKH